MIGLMPTPIPAVQTVGGTARNEPFYDSELFLNGVNLLGTGPGSIALFNDYSKFNTVTAPVTAKGDIRDTNMSGSGASGLPQGNQMFAYFVENELHTGDADLSLAANSNMFEILHRIRRLAGFQLVINQNNIYITRRLVDLVGASDSLHAMTTHGASMVVTQAVGDRKGASLQSTQRYKIKVKDKASGKDVEKTTKIDNAPYVLHSLQNLRAKIVIQATTAAATLILPVPVFCVIKFIGILVRGIT